MTILVYRLVGAAVGAGLLLLGALAACSGPESIVPNAEIAVTPSTVILEAGETHTFTAVVTGSSNSSVTWWTTGGSIAGTGNSISFTAPALDGKYLLTAVSNSDNTRAASAVIEVVGRPMESVVGVVQRNGGTVGFEEYSTWVQFPDGSLQGDSAVRASVYERDLTSGESFASAIGLNVAVEIDVEALDLRDGNVFYIVAPSVTQATENIWAFVVLELDGEARYRFIANYEPGVDEVIPFFAHELLDIFEAHGSVPTKLRIQVQVTTIEPPPTGELLSPMANYGVAAGLSRFNPDGWSTKAASRICNSVNQGAPFEGLTLVLGRESVPTGKTPLVLIHGWQALVEFANDKNPFQFDKGAFNAALCGWRNYFEKMADDPELLEKYEIYTFAYNSSDRVKTSADQLERQLKRAFGDQPVVLVGHSMGGMVARDYSLRSTTRNVHHVIALGAPFRGSRFLICTQAEGDECKKVRTLAGLTNYDWFAPVAEAGGTKDLAWEFGGVSYLTSKNVLCTGSRDECFVSSQSKPNPYLTSLSLSPAHYENFTTYSGTLESRPITVDVYWNLYRTPSEELRRAGYHSDGIVPRQSACLSASREIDNSCASAVAGKGYKVSRTTHSEIIDQRTYDSVKRDLLSVFKTVPPVPTNPQPPTEPEPPTGPPPPPVRGPGSFTLEQAQPFCTTSLTPGVRLSWTTSDGATSYEILRDGVQIYELAGLHPEFENTSGLTAGSRHDYTIRARNSAGEATTNTRSVSIPTDICETGNPPGEPTPGAGALAITPLGGFSAESVIGTLPSPNSTDYTLTNTGAGTLNWSVSSTVDWLTVNPSSGSLAPSEKVTVGVRINVAARNLRPGSHAGTVRFSADGPISGSSERTVTLALADLPPDPTIFSKLEASPTSIAFHGEVGERPSSRTITLTNSGRADSNYQVSYPGWLDVTPYSGSLASGRSTTVQIRPVRCERRETLTGLIQFRDQDSLANVSVSMECSNAEPTTGMLRISTSGVPTGYRKAFGTVTGPNGYYEEIDVSDISLSIPAGTYTVQMDGFRYGNDRYFADVSRRSVQVNVGRTSQVSFRYEKEITLPVTELLSNRSFDRTNNWSISGDAWVWNGGTENKYHSPSGYAALGVDRNGYAKSFASGDITQEVVIPAGAKTGRVSFYYQMDVISTTYGSDFTIALYAGRCSSNYALVRGGRALQARDARSSYTFVQSTTFDVADLVGSTVCFRLSGGTSAGEQIVLRLDDVSLTVWGN